MDEFQFQDAMTPCSMVSKYSHTTSSKTLGWHRDALPEISRTNHNGLNSKLSNTFNHILNLPVTVEKVGNSYEIINITGLE